MSDEHARSQNGSAPMDLGGSFEYAFEGEARLSIDGLIVRRGGKRYWILTEFLAHIVVPRKIAKLFDKKRVKITIEVLPLLLVPVLLFLVGSSTPAVLAQAANQTNVSAPAIPTVEFPMELTLPTPGSIALFFEAAPNVLANATSEEALPFELRAYEDHAVFTVNTTGNYKVNITIVYDRELSQNVLFVVKSPNLLYTRYEVPAKAQRLVFLLDVRAVPAPKYPSAKEIAEEQSKYIKSYIDEAVEKAVKPINDRIDRLSRDVYQLDKDFIGLKKDLRDFEERHKQAYQDLRDLVGELQAAQQDFWANSWTTIAIIGAVVAVAFAYNIFRSELPERRPQIRDVFKVTRKKPKREEAETK